MSTAFACPEGTTNCNDDRNVVVFIYYSSGSILGVVAGFGLGLIGLVLALERRVGTRTASA